MENKFTEKDFETFQEVMQFLIAKPEWRLSTQEVMKLNKYLAFLNQVNNKIKANILEIGPEKKPIKPRAKK